MINVLYNTSSISTTTKSTISLTTGKRRNMNIVHNFQGTCLFLKKICCRNLVSVENPAVYRTSSVTLNYTISNWVFSAKKARFPNAYDTEYISNF